LPELPEVETIVRDIRPALVGRRIRRATLSHDDVLRGVTRRRLIRRLTGATIKSVSRRAKHAVLELDSGRLVVQPGMTGSLMVHRRPLSPEAAKYAVLRVELDRGGELVYQDVRRLGTLLFLDEKEWQRYSGLIGPEPLEEEFSVEQFGTTLERSRQAIK
jgi:formamidopyrimidine-DNA glycosylase